MVTEVYNSADECFKAFESCLNQVNADESLLYNEASNLVGIRKFIKTQEEKNYFRKLIPDLAKILSKPNRTKVESEKVAMIITASLENCLLI